MLAGGDPATEIVAAADRESCDLIAMAVHGHRGLQDVLYGDTADGAWIFDQIRSGVDISVMRDTLIFGPSFNLPDADGDPVAAAPADTLRAA